MEVIRHGKYKSAVEPFWKRNECCQQGTSHSLIKLCLELGNRWYLKAEIFVEKLNEIANGLLARNLKWLKAKN
jgi:protease-4